MLGRSRLIRGGGGGKRNKKEKKRADSSPPEQSPATNTKHEDETTQQDAAKATTTTQKLLLVQTTGETAELNSKDKNSHTDTAETPADPPLPPQPMVQNNKKDEIMVIETNPDMVEKQQQTTATSRRVLSPNAKQLLDDDCDDYTQCIDLNVCDDDDVSSLNDSIYFGGGASVTGGYSSRHHIRQQWAANAAVAAAAQNGKSLLAGDLHSPPPPPGSTPETPINLLGDHPNDDVAAADQDIVSMENGDLQLNIENLKKKRTTKEEEEENANNHHPQLGPNLTMSTSDSPTSAKNNHKKKKKKKSETNNRKEDDDNDNDGCLAWIMRSPCWLQTVVFGSLALLVAAIVLVSVGMSVAMGQSKNKSSISDSTNNEDNNNNAPPTTPWWENNSGPSAPTVLTTNAPVPAPTVELVLAEGESPAPAAANPTAAPTTVMSSPTKEAPIGSTTLPPTVASTTTTDAPIISPTPPPTSAPVPSPPTAAPIRGKSPTQAPVVVTTLAPTASPTAVPRAAPVVAATAAPTTTAQTGDPKMLHVYLMAGPATSDTFQDQAPELLSDLPITDDAFVVHLGDWNNPSSSRCREENFQDISSLFQSSSLPVYFIMGDNESNDCQNPDRAKELWKENLMNFETQYFDSPSWKIFRQGDNSAEYADYSENFMFAHDKVAFLSINLTGGQHRDGGELSMRHDANLVWIDAAYQFYRRQAQTFFILTHDGPPGLSGSPDNASFYDTLFEKMEEDYKDVEFVLVHRAGQVWGYRQRYNGIRNLSVVSVLGPILPPKRLDIQDGKLLEIGDAWYDDLN